MRMSRQTGRQLLQRTLVLGIMDIHSSPRKKTPCNNSSSSPAFAHQDQHKLREGAAFKHITFNSGLTLTSNPGASLWDSASENKKSSFSFLHLECPHSGHKPLHGSVQQCSPWHTFYNGASAEEPLESGEIITGNYHIWIAACRVWWCRACIIHPS